jgi:hypothetical protein
LKGRKKEKSREKGREEERRRNFFTISTSIPHHRCYMQSTISNMNGTIKCEAIR